MNKKHIGLDVPLPDLTRAWAFARKWLLPNPGTLVLMIILALAIPTLAAPRNVPEATSLSTVSYQGRLADSAGNPLTGYYSIEFRIYDDPSVGAPLWEEYWTGGNAVSVSDGLFNVMLGSIAPGLPEAIQDHQELYLGITVGTDTEMVPRVQLGSVPFAMQALSANVPDGSITTAKLADGAVTTSKLNVDAPLKVKGGGGALLQLETQAGETTNYIRFASTGSPGEYGDIGFPNGDTTELEIYNPQPGGAIQFVVPGPTHAVYIDGSTGFVGIRNRNPDAALDVQGDFHVHGYKAAVMETATFGTRTLYSVESPEVRFIDEGVSHLEKGVARVELDPVFLETIEGRYLVHVTPYGDASLYVAEVGKDYFVVKAHEGDADVEFAWSLSATRKGYEGVRLEQADK